MDNKRDVHYRIHPPFKLHDLIKMDDHEEIYRETKNIISMMYKDFDYTFYDTIYSDMIRLFKGEYPGYRPCNTDYHDLNHTLNTLLAMVRMMHGYFIKNNNLSNNMLLLGILGALFHDTGYIQKIGDKKGTGARYTLKHVERSIRFTRDYLKAKGFLKKDINDCASILKCTIITKNINSIRFRSDEIMILGKMLGTADFISQMADRVYLEKLLFLFREFIEGNITGFDDEFDLLKKTASFYNNVQQRFYDQLGGMEEYVIYHFIERWGIHEDLYKKAIENNMGYLKKIIDDFSHNYLNYLKRGNIVEKLKKTHHNPKGD
ncbi:MAG TPA: hypothetical protein PKW07_02620 [Syntrophorhabdaceae bacterium]|mgnify:CR=1 FL=1|nr:hypothetical protein [Syntrophorhabdaceae bacterium]